MFHFGVGYTHHKKSGLKMRPDVFLNLPSNTNRTIKKIIYFKKKSEDEPGLLNGSFDFDVFSIQILN